MQKMLSEFAYCESDRVENNTNIRRVNRILLDNGTLPGHEYLEVEEDINSDKYNGNGKVLTQNFDYKEDLSRNLADNYQLPTQVKCFEIESEKQESLKAPNPVTYNDDQPPTLDSDEECKDCFKSLNKVQRLGVNPFQIGILINKSDFLDHCIKVKSGSLKHRIKSTKISRHIEKERLEQYSQDLELTPDCKSFGTLPVTETKSEGPVNAHEKTAFVKFTSHKNCTDKSRRFNKDDQKTIDVLHSKSVSDLIQHFESNCDGKPQKKKRNYSRNTNRNRKSNNSNSNENAGSEINVETQSKKDNVQNNLLSCSLKKVNDSIVYMYSLSNETTRNVYVENNDSNPSVNNYAKFSLMEVFWFGVVTLTIFWHLIDV